MNQHLPPDKHFDAIIVGGRPAGATLAARLGMLGLRVLLLERDTFPSLPAASCPVIYPSTMRLLDEIGAVEAEYARDTPRLREINTQIRDDFRSRIAVPDRFGRDYAYAIDRARFDDALWRTAARQPGVTALQGIVVTDLLRASGRVSGVRARAADGAELSWTADCVVGADGRFSLVARKAGARDLDRRDDLPTSIYYAYWRSAAPYADGPTIQIFGAGRGVGYLLMDSADGATCVAVGGRAALFEGQERPAERYTRLLREQPQVWRRLAHAEQTSEVRGMRNIGNLYREAGGPGWALTGDALHQKDPLDGQGIYDAVFTAKALAEAIGAWKRGSASWEQALESYNAAVRAETYPMYQITLERVRLELYTPRPDWAYKTWIRWVSTDAEYRRRFGLLLARAIDPARWFPPTAFLGALARGALGDLGRLLSRRPPHYEPQSAQR
ncbi:MAG TPA: NAD(P)/FAD-dependent oxidoreductase [Roseiflexaceae bacterium]|nr:NAD(P)/FAD-dependent oxidoreductase [Roseiflexaceae bacterium]